MMTSEQATELRVCKEIADKARQLIIEAERLGVVLRIELHPEKPFSMGHYSMVAETWLAREMAE